MKEFWNERYGSLAYAYGEKPNVFLRGYLKAKTPGKILFPAEGEGRNAVFAAGLGWQVEAFDFSEEAQKKAFKLARKENVEMTYQLSDFEHFKPLDSPYDVIGLIYVHTDPDTRKSFISKAINLLKEEGEVVMEVYSENQLGKTSGGPKNKDLLWSKVELESIFKSMKIVVLEEIEIELDEGQFHQGSASVLRLIAKKK